MIDKIQAAYDEMIANWNTMQSSDMDSAGDDADRFQSSFYRFIEELQEWLVTAEPKPRTVDAAMALPWLAELYEELPAPLMLNFETELELIVEGITREEDARYDE
ncbi:hypothetical protein CIG75_04565 [Tumebacillus algifaecis]|uniref:Uncharacterized protein n=1 Tax=Tumebacillus algifaecis TaxID=1214604 RepID=A0A223CYT0_9BACL|nr:hypothetical protein [Tumebacillus algifaecis]ASS74326.1 hypothetical protein CIG75_04565 [Tumebacillus algifaecis]